MLDAVRPNREGESITTASVTVSPGALFISGNEAMWTRDGKLTRRYYRHASDRPFLIASKLFGSGAFFQYEYEDSALMSLHDQQGVAVQIARNDSGRIDRVTDRDGRSVSYVYDQNGRLQTVRDVAGNDWEYDYGEGGLLLAATGPNGKMVLRARYNQDRHAHLRRVR